MINFQPKEGEYWVSGRSDEEALEKAAKKFNVAKEKIKLERGTCVLLVWVLLSALLTLHEMMMCQF